jgi:hypothetical protein
MPPMKRGAWPFGFQQGLAQPLPPYEPDPMTFPWPKPTVMYPGSLPTIPGLPYPPPGWPAFPWPIVPMSGTPRAYPQTGPARGPRVMSRLVSFLNGEGGDYESPEAAPDSRRGSCDGQCSKHKKR